MTNVYVFYEVANSYKFAQITHTILYDLSGPQ